MARTKKTKEEVTKEDVKVEEKKEKEILTPSEYFEKIKGMKNFADREELQAFYDTAMSKFKKYMITGQKEPARHLFNLCKLAQREMDILDAGIDTFIYRKDIDTYVEKVADECVVCIELENYQRDIPDDIVDKLVMCKEKNLFDKYYIFFTDYTGEHRSKVEEKKKAKDPIIFGNCLIEDKVSDRMYFIGDWVDEYCSLTLDKMIQAMTEAYVDGESMKRSVTPILTLEEAEDILNGKITDLLVFNKRESGDTKKKSTSTKEKSTTTEATTPKKKGRKKKNEE